MADQLPEPWLRGDRAGSHPLLAPVLYSFVQAREDLAQCTEDLTLDHLWARPGDVAPIGFHIRHIGGSTDRLLTYALGKSLSDEQMASMRTERHAGASRESLLAELDAALANAEAVIRGIDVATLGEAREVGRKKLPTTVIGLLVHIAEHAQRHVGQAVTTAKIVRSISS